MVDRSVARLNYEKGAEGLISFKSFFFAFFLFFLLFFQSTAPFTHYEFKWNPRTWTQDCLWCLDDHGGDTHLCRLVCVSDRHEATSQCSQEKVNLAFGRFRRWRKRVWDSQLQRCLDVSYHGLDHTLLSVLDLPLCWQGLYQLDDHWLLWLDGHDGYGKDGFTGGSKDDPHLLIEIHPAIQAHAKHQRKR